MRQWLFKMRLLLVTIVLSLLSYSCHLSSDKTVMLYKPDYGDVKSRQKALERWDYIEDIVAKADLRLFLKSDRTYSVTHALSGKNHCLETHREFRDYVNSYEPKGFVVVTMGKNRWSEKKLAKQVNKTYQALVKAGFKRILIDQVGGGVARGVYVDEYNLN